VRLDDLHYDLPASLIAQFPTERREDARLMVVDRQAGATRDARITDLPSLLKPGDLLVVNETRVRPARLGLVRSSTGGRAETVFANVEGAVAAPTAGLHFSQPLLAALEHRGIDVSRIVLHVGPGTFRPVIHADPGEHPMDAEYFEVSPATADRALASRTRGGRIVAVGTTVVRALESACGACGGRLG